MEYPKWVKRLPVKMRTKVCAALDDAFEAGVNQELERMRSVVQELRELRAKSEIQDEYEDRSRQRGVNTSPLFDERD